MTVSKKVISRRSAFSNKFRLFFFNRLRRRPNQANKSALSSSFNNPGYEPHHRDDESDASPFTIPEYEEMSPFFFQRERKSSGNEGMDPLYAEIGPSLAAKTRESRNHQRGGEVHLRQASGHAFEKMDRTSGRLPTQIHNDIAKHRGRKRSNPIAASNPTYEAFPSEFKSNSNRSKVNSSSHMNGSLDKGVRENYSKGDQREAPPGCSSRENSPDSGYSNLAKREFHKDALRHEEPHYFKPPRKMFCPTSSLETSVGGARSENFYAPLGMLPVPPSSDNKFQFNGYAQLDPSSLIPAGDRKDRRKIRTSQDQLHHVNTVHPDLGSHRPRKSTAFDTAEDSESHSREENRVTKKRRPRSSKTKASGQLGPAEERMEYENYTYGHPRNNQDGWTGNPKVNNSRKDNRAVESSRPRPRKTKASGQLGPAEERMEYENYTYGHPRNNQDGWTGNPKVNNSRKDNTAVESSRPRPSKTRASGQFDFPPEERGTDENYSFNPQRRNNPEDSRDEEAPILYLTSDLGPDETII